MAHRRLPRFVLEYLEGGADGEACPRAQSRSAGGMAFYAPLAGRCIAPRHLDGAVRPPHGDAGRDRADRAQLHMFWPHADLRLAQAAAAAGIPSAQSTMSNDLMERVARVPGLRYWWQLYVFGPREIRENLIERASDAGCEALIVTTDAQIYGNREWQSACNPDPTNAVLDRQARSAAPSALADRAGADARPAALRERHPVRAQGAPRPASTARIGSARRWTAALSWDTVSPSATAGRAS